MYEIRQTQEFAQWFEELSDRQTRARIDIHIRRISLGNLGDVKSVGGGVFELRIHFGPGYRVYFLKKGIQLIILLAGGNKATQQKDIKKAYKLAQIFQED